jgi:hypothetical protein
MTDPAAIRMPRRRQRSFVLVPPRACRLCGKPPLRRWRLCSACWAERFGMPASAQLSLGDQTDSEAPA